MSRTSKTLISIVVVLLIIWGGVSIYKKNTKPVITGPIKIGVMTILSGDLAFLGENVRNSAQLAIDDLNKDGRYGQVQLIVEDVGGLADQAKAVSAFHKLVDVDHVQYIIDGMTSNGTMAVAPLLDQSRVTMVTPLTGGENVDNAAEYLFRNGPSDIKAGTLPAEQLMSKFHYTKVALLSDNAEYTNDIAKHFRAAFKGTLVSDQTIAPSKTDYRTELAKVKTSGAEAIVINTADGVSSTYLIKQARELGIKAPIFANFIAFGPNLLKTGAAGGVYIYDPEFNEGSSAVQAFLAEYTQKYRADSPIRFHTTGTYDAVKMGLEAITSVGYDGTKIHDYLLSHIQNWAGYNGTVSFDAKGNTQTGFVLKQIKNGALVLVP